MAIEATFTFPIIRKDYIQAAIQTLRDTTPEGVEFRVIVVDQTLDGIFEDFTLWTEIKRKIDLYIRPPRNLGFAKAMNEGIIHGLHWGSKYVVACNDDVEFLDSRWWQGILDQFEAFPKMMAINPASIIEPGWGYGVGLPDHKTPDWGVLVGSDIYPKKKDGKAFTYKEAKTKEGYDWLLKDYKQGHIEGFAGWCVIGKREMWKNVGLYDERFTPGGGEDYDLCHRIYMADGRASATMRSWVWHWWGKSKEIVHKDATKLLPTNRGTFQNTNGLFQHSKDGANSPIYPPRTEEEHGNKRMRKSMGVFADDIR